MTAAWKTAKLSEVCEFLNGLWKGEKPPFVKIGVIRNTNFSKDGSLDYSDIAYLDVEERKLEKRRLQFGDIILEKSGGGPKQPVGRVALFDKNDGVFSFSNFTSAIRVRDSTQLDFRFLHRFLHWIYVSGRTAAIQSHSTGIRNLDGDAYKAIPIAFPPLAEQKRIVAILDQAFQAIDAATICAEKSRADANVLLDRYLRSVFDEESSQGSRCSVGDQVTLQRGFDITKKEQREGNVPVVSSGGVKSFHDTAMVKAPGVVIGRKGSVGTVFYVESDFWAHDTTLWVKDFKGNNPRFVYYAFRSLNLKQLDSGAANPALNRNNVHPIKINWTPPEKQAAIVATLDGLATAIDQLATTYSRKTELLGALRQSLLASAFSGEL